MEGLLLSHMLKSEKKKNSCLSSGSQAVGHDDWKVHISDDF